jgi:hypothetical protein
MICGMAEIIAYIIELNNAGRLDANVWITYATADTSGGRRV